MASKSRRRKKKEDSFSGVLRQPVIIEVERDNGPYLWGFPAGERVILTVDRSLPNFVRPQDMHEVAQMVHDINEEHVGDEGLEDA